MRNSTISEIGSALASATRLLILAKASELPMTVGMLARELGLSQSTISYHLAILRSSGLVNIEEEGTRHYVEVLYSVIRIPLGVQAA
jgi:DNA-binding transcriptional ArsR family regulator